MLMAGMYWGDLWYLYYYKSAQIQAHAYRGTKQYISQNVLVTVDFYTRFTYVLAGWKSSAHDAI
jgi:hypothetical protein